jgi:hypothetical protein
VKATTHVINRAASLSNPGKYLLHHAGFVKNKVKAGITTPFLLGHIAIAVGCMTEDPDASLLGSMTLTPSAAFEKLGPLIFGDHALHLQQQLIFWSLAQRSVEKNDLHASLVQFIQEEHLIGVVASETIGTMDIQAIDASCRCNIAEALQRWPNQG